MKIEVDIVKYPGKTLSPQKLKEFVQDLRKVASTCFTQIPDYQILSGNKDDCDRAIVSVARNKKGEILGFCSALILPLSDKENFFHTGLTCVKPSARGLKLTHKLTSKVLISYILRESFFKKIWVSNCACVISSIGNIAKHFDEVYPSPYFNDVPTAKHKAIATKISQCYREQIAINDSAVYNPQSFVFEGSVNNSEFQKEASDTRFHHRDERLTEYYKSLLNFDRGDEIIQVASCSLLTFPRYFMGKLKFKKKKKPLRIIHA